MNPIKIYHFCTKLQGSWVFMVMLNTILDTVLVNVGAKVTRNHNCCIQTARITWLAYRQRPNHPPGADADSVAQSDWLGESAFARVSLRVWLWLVAWYFFLSVVGMRIFSQISVQFDAYATIGAKSSQIWKKVFKQSKHISIYLCWKVSSPSQGRDQDPESPGPEWYPIRRQDVRFLHFPKSSLHCLRIDGVSWRFLCLEHCA